MPRRLRHAAALLLALSVLAGGYLFWHGRSAGQGAEALYAAQALDAAGKPADLQAWRGQLVLVNVWATWCAPCREEMPLLDSLASAGPPQGVKVLGVAWDSAENVAAYLRESPVRYPVVSLRGGASELMVALGNPAQVMPFSVLLSPSGRVLARHAGALEAPMLVAWLHEHSGQSGPILK